jgi:nitrogenase molybdenum-iron protein NifN
MKGTFETKNLRFSFHTFSFLQKKDGVMIAPVRNEPSLSAEAPPPKTASRNACKVCAPLGACLAFRGIEGAIAFLHGSQGCSTYIRRYMISHFKEPIDIACSNFAEATTVFGGRENLRQGLENVIRQYEPKVVGIATTCLAETIGEDVADHLREIRNTAAGPWPEIVHVGTPSYAGTHAEGFHAAIRAIVDTFVADGVPAGGSRENVVNLLPGIVSPADLRYLKGILRDFGVEPIVLSDYSDTLDAPTWSEYQRIPQGGTPLAAIRRMGRAMATIEFGSTADPAKTAGALLKERFGVPNYFMPQPVGVIQTDRFFEALTAITGRPTPAEHADQRGRLIDAYVDAHKYVFGKRAVVYGEQDLVVAIASLLMEIGVDPVLCGSGARTGKLRQRIEELDSADGLEMTVIEGADFGELDDRAAAVQPDLIVGNSKGYSMARKLGVPLVRIGFPIHDRIDGPRTLHVGYCGAQRLFDRIANALIETAQDGSDVGYTYM